MELIVVLIVEMALRGSNFSGGRGEDYAGFYFNLGSRKQKTIGTPSVPSVKKYSAKIINVRPLIIIKKK